MGKTELSPGALLIRKARLLLFSTTLLWGISFPLMRGLQLAQKAHVPHVPDLALSCSVVAVRFALAALILFPFYARQLLRITVTEWSQAIGLAVLAAGGLYLQTLGLAWTDASIAAFLTQLYTLIVPLIVAFRDRRAPSLRVIVACALVLVGVAILSPGLLRQFTLGLGEVVIIIGAVFTAGQIVWLERPAYAENRAGLVTLLMFAILAGMMSCAYFLSGGTCADAGQLFDTPPLAILMGLLVLLCTLFNFLIMNTWQRCVSATEAGLIYSIEPVIATVSTAFLPGWMSWLASVEYPNETLTWSLLIGGLLILTATILVATEKRTAD